MRRKWSSTISRAEVDLRRLRSIAATCSQSAVALSRVAAFCLVRHPECDQLTTFVFEPSPIFLVHKFQECKSLMGIVLNFGSSPANMPTPSNTQRMSSICCGGIGSFHECRFKADDITRRHAFLIEFPAAESLRHCVQTRLASRFPGRPL